MIDEEEALPLRPMTRAPDNSDTLGAAKLFFGNSDECHSEVPEQSVMRDEMNDTGIAELIDGIKH